MIILVLNVGSSSQKSCLYEISSESLPAKAPQPLWEGKVDWTHRQGVAEIEIKTSDNFLREEISTDSQSEVISHLLDTLTMVSKP